MTAQLIISAEYISVQFMEIVIFAHLWASESLDHLTEWIKKCPFMK